MAGAGLGLVGGTHKLPYVRLDGPLVARQKGSFVPPFPSLSSAICPVAAASSEDRFAVARPVAALSLTTDRRVGDRGFPHLPRSLAAPAAQS